MLVCVGVTVLVGVCVGVRVGSVKVLEIMGWRVCGGLRRCAGGRLGRSLR